MTTEFMGFPNYSFPPDPKRHDPQWVDITSECRELIDELRSNAEKLFGSSDRSLIAVRVTQFSEGPRICVRNNVAYIRLGPGVGLGPSAEQKQDLRHQIAVELAHFVLSLPDTSPMPQLEEGLTAYFAAKQGGFAPQDDPDQVKYKKPYEIVERLLCKYPDAIRQLREPPRTIRAVYFDEIRKICPEFPEDDLKFLLSKW